MKAVLVFNAFIWALLYVVLSFQNVLPMNFVGVAEQSWDLAFHTASSFTSNTNQQHYSGETLSVFTHTFAIGIAMFLTPATGLALMPAFARAFNNDEDPRLGNFYENVVRGVVRFLLPFSFVIALVLMTEGSVQTITSGKLTAETFTMGVQNIRIGPHAGIEAIKMWGTNGGGINGANASTAFENPTPLSNLVLTLAMPVSTFCAIYAWGAWVGNRSHGIVLVTAFFVIYAALTGVAVVGERPCERGHEREPGRGRQEHRNPDRERVGEHGEVLAAVMLLVRVRGERTRGVEREFVHLEHEPATLQRRDPLRVHAQIGRASCRERV